jgi:hypothetical protein
VKNDRIDTMVAAYRHSVEAWQTIQCAARQRAAAIREEIEADLKLYLAERYEARVGEVEALDRAAAEFAHQLQRIFTGVETHGDQ